MKNSGLCAACSSIGVSIQFNVYYHYGLALYLSRRWEDAAAIYRQCLDWIKPGKYDELTSITNWQTYFERSW